MTIVNTHYQSLKLYVSLGMCINKIHRMQAFHQDVWMKKYINFNTWKQQDVVKSF